MNRKPVTFNEALPEGIEQMSPEELKGLIVTRMAKTSNLAEVAANAYMAYFADVEQQIQRIRVELNKLETQRNTITQAKDEEMDKLVRFTIAGNTEGMRNQREKLHDLEIKLASVIGQIEGFQSFEIRGSEALMDAAFDAADRLGEDGAQMTFFCESVKAIAKKHFEMWRSVVDLDIESPAMPEVEKIGEHFHRTSVETAKDAIEAAERKEAIAEDRQRSLKEQEERFRRDEEKRIAWQEKTAQAIVGTRVRDKASGRTTIMQVDPVTGEEIGPMPKAYLNHFAD